MHHRTGGGGGGGGHGMQDVIQMCSSFDANKSTKGASKLRRDLINAEIANLRDLLPLPSSTRQRLSQLQLMALVCVYVRKANYFQQVFKMHHELGHPYCMPNFGFSKALSGFLIMMTQNGKLLYISDNAAEYLGHSMEDLLIHGDSVYDIIDKADHGTVQTELLRGGGSAAAALSGAHHHHAEESRLFLCRMNVSRNARRQMRFGDQKVVLLEGHYLSYLPLCSRKEPVFIATCTPVAMPETRECVVQGATNVFTTIHSMDMKFVHVDRNGEYYLGYTRSELSGLSWYQLVHWNFMREAQNKHRLISQSEQEKSCILLLRLETRAGDWIWVHCVLQVKDGHESTSSTSGATAGGTSSNGATAQSVIVATNQVLSEREAGVMRANSWIYHYYTVQTKLQYGLAYPETTSSPTSAAAAAARLAAAAAYFPAAAHQLIGYGPQPASPSMESGGYTTPLLQPPANVTPDPQQQINPPTYPYHHPHHPHPHPHPHNPHVVNGKESPLDFSLAAAAAAAASNTTMFVDYSSYGNYWHHQSSVGGYHHRSGGESAGSASGGGGNHHHHHHWNSSAGGGSVVSHSSLVQQHQAAITQPPASSPTSNTSTAAPRSKRFKKSAETRTASIARAHASFEDLHPETNGDGGDVLTMSPFQYHTSSSRHRAMYKMVSSSSSSNSSFLHTPSTTSSEDEMTSVKDEQHASLISCPLTPSPIWEGQTQRVPDLGYYHQSGAATAAPPTVAAAGGGATADLIHCVPTYQPYAYYGASATAISNSLPFGTAAAAAAAAASAASTQGLLLAQAPGKDSTRLPPTPDSEHETEDTRAVKWETL